MCSNVTTQPLSNKSENSISDENNYEKMNTPCIQHIDENYQGNTNSKEESSKEIIDNEEASNSCFFNRFISNCCQFGNCAHNSCCGDTQCDCVCLYRDCCKCSSITNSDSCCQCDCICFKNI